MKRLDVVPEVFAIIFYFASALPALAAPTEFDHPDGTKHYYDLISSDDYISWDAAKSHSESLSYNSLFGHLATVTSAAENSVLLSFGTTEAVPYWSWLGGFQPSQPESQTDPSLNWTWVTGESWQYTHWDGGEPNDYDHQDHPGHPTIGEENNEENYLTFQRNPAQAGFWNDYTNSKSYFVEYEPTVTPEPATMALFGLGAGALALTRRRKKLEN